MAASSATSPSISSIQFFPGDRPSALPWTIIASRMRRSRRVRWTGEAPAEAGKGQSIDIRSIEGPVGFLMSIINAAKDWQDVLQSALPGCPRADFHVHLKGSEGGLNLNMSQETIDLLVELGQPRRNPFDQEIRPTERHQRFLKMDDHRWRQFLVAFARLEEPLCSAARPSRNSVSPGKLCRFRPNNSQPTILRRFHTSLAEGRFSSVSTA